MKLIPYNKNIWQLKFSLFLTIIFAVSSAAFSQNTETQSVRQYAADFFNASQQSKTGLKSNVSASSLTQCYQSPNQVRTPLFVFKQAEKGFAMIAKSNNTYKIVGYSDEEIFQSENMPPQLRELMNYYEDSLVFINPVSMVMAAGNPIVSALLYEHNIKLNQFNHPEVGGSYTGCVATAMTQILLFHAAEQNKLIKGYGSHCYTYGSYGEICADFENSIYNSAELLSYHVAISMDMRFTTEGSSPPGWNISQRMEEYFHYFVNESITDNFYLKNELENRRPVFAAITGLPENHAIVFDGYDTQGYFHLNFGWGGISNGYYLMNNGTWFGAGSAKFYTSPYTLFIVTPTPPSINKQDSLALVAVHNALGGFEQTNWDLTKPVWIWPGVLTMNDRVIRLTLNSAIPSASGQSIAPEIGNLTALQELTFSGYLNGIIPSTITKLTDLKKLIIANNAVYIAPIMHKGNLKGELPADIGKLTKLEWLSIYNALEGTIPASIGNLTNLKILHIDQDNDSFGQGNLTGPIPIEIGNLSMLNQLHITNQNLNGDIPATINNLIELRELVLFGNQLSGSVPAMSLPNLGYLKLNDNLFSKIDEGSVNCPSLILIELQNNQIGGNIPSNWGNFTALKSLNLSNNKIESLPEEVGNLIQLESFTIDNNQLKALPNGIAQPINLKHFSANNNQIAYLPNNFAQSHNLETLDLSNNQITSIPDEIGNCPNLYEILLNNNKIDSIPATFANIMDLATVMLEDNEMQGKIPEKLMTSKTPNSKFVRLDRNRFVFENIPKTEQLRFGIRDQKDVLLNKQFYLVQIGDTISIDIRTISNLSHPDNEYFWLKYPEFTSNIIKDERFNVLANNPTLKIIIDNETIKNKYYCKVFNSKSPSFSFEYNGSTVTSACIKYLNTDTIAFKLATDEEIIAEEYPKEFVTSLSEILDKTITDGTVTLVPPPKIKRGKVQWEASTDSLIWEKVSETMENVDLKANIKSISNDKLVLAPKNTAYYRCCINETNCDLLYSKILKVKALGDILFDEIINATAETLTISVDSIEVVVPANFHDSDFRLIITKIENPPAVPASVIAGSAYDISVSFGDTFKTPLLIKLKNIDKTKVNEKDIDRLKAVYFDDINQEWKLFDHAHISLKDSTLTFTTNHLTKLSWWWDEEVIWGYTDVYERNNIRIFYKEDDLDYMKFGYAKKQSSQSWHISGIPILVQDITEYLPKVMAKYKSLGLEVPDGKFSVYIKKMEDAGCVGIMGMLDGYLSLSRDMLTPEELRQVLAHEFMHYTQDYYISANPGNSFWMEAHATLSDRIVWNDSEVSISESEQLLESGRTSKNSIFYFLSNSWDYWDKSFVTNNLLGSIHYNYLAGTFLHYMRSFREKSEKLEPATLLKETTWLQGWRAYLGSYVSKYLHTTLGDEYEDYVKYILSGENEKFSLINKKGNPYSYLQNPDNKQVFTYPITYRFKKGDEMVQKDDMEIKVPYLSSKIVLLENINTDTLVLVNYKRKHNFNNDHLVYYATYDFQKQEMVYINISDSTEYTFLLDTRNKENTLTKFKNYSFLLLINKSYIGLSPLIKDFEASFELSASPILNIENVAKLDIYNGDTPIQHNFGDKLEYITFGILESAWLQEVTGFDTKVINVSTSKQILNNQSYRVITKFTQIIDQGKMKGSPTMRDSTIYMQTIDYNSISGTVKITEHANKFYKLNTFIDFVANPGGDVVEKLIYTEYTYMIEDFTKTYWLEGIMSFIQPPATYSGFELIYGKKINIFKTNNTAETQNLLSKIDGNIKRTYFSENGAVSSQKELNYLSTDFSNPNLYVFFVIRTRAID